MIAYHLLHADMTAGYGTEPPWSVGETRTIDGPIALCERGYHSSPTLWDALTYAPGPVACLVEIPDTGTIHNTGDEPKSVSPSRTLVAAVNIDRELRLFTADCAEHVLYLFEHEYPDDDRPRKAIEAARQFANGEIDAASAASAVGAESAAWAAWVASVASAVGAASAASAAIAVGAASAAWAAWAASAVGAVGAESAAWAAARAAAWDAARDAERSWQREQFEQRFAGLFEAVAS